MKNSPLFRFSMLAGALALALPLAASAQVKVGLTLASTGPAASLGIPERNTVALLPKEVDGQKIEYFVLDDGTDTTRAVKNMRKLITDDNVVVVVVSPGTHISLAVVDVAGDTQTPLISGAARPDICSPVTAPPTCVFRSAERCV